MHRRRELSPHLRSLFIDLDSLNPRSFVQKNLFGDEDDEYGQNLQSQRPASRIKSEQTPYDPDTL